MNLSKLKVLKIGGHYKVKPFDRLIEEYRPQELRYRLIKHVSTEFATNLAHY